MSPSTPGNGGELMRIASLPRKWRVGSSCVWYRGRGGGGRVQPIAAPRCRGRGTGRGRPRSRRRQARTARRSAENRAGGNPSPGSRWISDKTTDGSRSSHPPPSFCIRPQVGTYTVYAGRWERCVPLKASGYAKLPGTAMRSTLWINCMTSSEYTFSSAKRR